MDKWIQLGIIDPSKSPWAAPAFIVYQNGQPHMVIDYRKLNEIAISDKFPLPKQEDILQAFELCKQVLVNAPVRGYTKPGSSYRLSSYACNFRLAAILQQVQRI